MDDDYFEVAVPMLLVTMVAIEFGLLREAAAAAPDEIWVALGPLETLPICSADKLLILLDSTRPREDEALF